MSGTKSPSISAPTRVRNRSEKETTKGWSCVKRDGSTTEFDHTKILKALHKCFHSSDSALSDEERDAAAKKVCRQVVNSLAAAKNTSPNVEDVQRMVITHLWGDELYDEAEHYQNYREERRKARFNHPVPEETQARFDGMSKHFPEDVQIYQFLSKFSRWLDDEKRRETWDETVHGRVMPWFKRISAKYNAPLTDDEWTMLGDAMYSLQAGPAMRVVQMAGPALDRCEMGVYNCTAAPIVDLFTFPEMLYILMQGCGYGFSVESEFINELPPLKKQRGGEPKTVVVEDTTEGWCDAYHEALQLWWDGYDVHFDVHKVRKAGARLKTKGGRASGPGPLLELVAFTRNIVMKRQGKRLTDTDVHRLCCFIGRIVQVGGVRRSATISLSDLDSLGMRNIKSGNWWADTTYWIDGKYLSMANNSAVYEEQPSMEVFMDEWLALVKSKSGERGIINRAAAEKYKPARRKSARWLVNPCAEIILRPWGVCNLTIAVARKDDTVETLKHKVRVATYFGVLQSLCTDFGYVRKEWAKNCTEERLLGVDITGHADCPLLQFGAPGRAELLKELKQLVEDTAKPLSERFGIEYSAANTTVKPSGDSAVFFDCASGVSPRFAQHQIRWVRESKDSPIARYLTDAGVPNAPAPESPETLKVFGFPRSAPDNCTLRHHLSAIDQLNNWLEWKTCWAEHSVSATIYVDDHEWLAAGAWVYDHFDHITGLSFLPRDNGTYTYAPNEELTAEAYKDWYEKFPDLNWSKLTQYEDRDETEATRSIACTAGGCDV